MFTGIIEGLGTISNIRPSGHGKRFAIQADFNLDESKVGDSIAVNGACLTAVFLEGKYFEVDVSPETLAKTTFDKAKIGDRVNLERALRLSDRLDGHLVSGHIDGVGHIKQIKRKSNVIVIAIGVPSDLSRYMIRKGSVAVDGISLTINICELESFDVSIIPHTAEVTNIGLKTVGDKVNIETDIIGKYVERFIKEKPYKSEKGEKTDLDMQYLTKMGFI